MASLAAPPQRSLPRDAFLPRGTDGATRRDLRGGRCRDLPPARRAGPADVVLHPPVVRLAPRVLPPRRLAAPPRRRAGLHHLRPAQPARNTHADRQRAGLHASPATPPRAGRRRLLHPPPGAGRSCPPLPHPRRRPAPPAHDGRHRHGEADVEPRPPASVLRRIHPPLRLARKREPDVSTDICDFFQKTPTI